MDILLIDPPHSVLKGLPTDRGYSVGPASLAAYLRTAGIETAVLTGDLLMEPPSVNPLVALVRELRVSSKALAVGQRQLERVVNDRDHIIWKKLADTIRKASPMVVGITFLTPLKSVVERVAGLVREIDPKIKIVAGSFHPTFCPEEVMQNPDVDFVVRGEGEIPLLSLVKELKKSAPKLETVPGIYYRDGNGQVRSNPGVNLIANLDELPFPARDLVLECDYNVYRMHSVLTARGCPYQCSFCSEKRFWGGRVRRRSVNNVIGEMKLLKDTYKIDSVNIVDGTFTYDRDYVREFCNAMIDQKLNLRWGCTARYDNLDDDLLKLMKRANCLGLYLGLESGSARVLNAMDKKETVENMVRASRMIHDHGLISITSVLLGVPDERQEDIEQTIRLMRRFRTDFFDVNTYIPLAGSPLYESMSDEEKKKIDWRKVGYKSFDNYFCRNIPQRDFQRYQSEAYRIADSVRRKSLIRLAARSFYGMLTHSVSRIFGKGKGKAYSSPFSYG